MTPRQQLEMLIDGLRLLAAPAAEQVQAVPEYSCATDEVISTFSDAYLLVGQLERAGLVDGGAAAALSRVDDFLARMPADGALADPASLETHPLWAEARVLAAAALAALGQPLASPVLRHVEYVKQPPAGTGEAEG